MKVRFHWLPAALLASFVVLLSGVTVAVSLAGFRSLAEDSAHTTFSLIAARDADQLGAMFAGMGSIVRVQAARTPRRLPGEGRLDETALLPSLLEALRTYPNIDSLYFGLVDGTFFSVIGVRGSTRVAAVLHAPYGTEFAVREISPATDPHAPRREYWRFLDRDGRLLAQKRRDTDYVPAARPWYEGALGTSGLYATAPYRFDSVPGLGMTLAHALPDGHGAFGADLALFGLDNRLASSLGGREGGIVITDGEGRVLASHALGGFDATPPLALQPLAQTGNPLFAAAAGVLPADGSRIVKVNGEAFVYASRSVTIAPGQRLHVVAFAPTSLFTGAVTHVRNVLLLFAGLMLVIFLPLTEVVSRRITSALGALTSEAERIQRLDFSGEAAVSSMFVEIDSLGRAQHTMKGALRERTAALDDARGRLESLVHSSAQLASRRGRRAVMRQVLDSARLIMEVRQGQFWQDTGAGSLRLAACLRDGAVLPHPPAVEIDIDRSPDDPCVRALREGRRFLDQAATGYDMTVQRTLLEASQEREGDGFSLLVLAGDGEPLGVLTLVEAGTRLSSTRFDAEALRYAEMLAAQVGIALENNALLDSQRDLMEAMLQLLAGAIDSKSPYTGGHCPRVPELARMLAEAACEVSEGSLADFRFETDDEWREFRIGTWLHDCGKITTPEHVVDKATKLETIYNRIHEVRMRFEVLWRDAEIAHLKACLAGAEPLASRREMEARQARLEADFAFVAQCNLGAESMPEENGERLRAIGRQTWQRHFDDELGISQIEAARRAGLPREALPATETLLADKPEHVVPRTQEQYYDPRYGFCMPVPEHLYDFGELHNLAVSRGTLTPEERYKINEHITQTIVMLDQLPWPARMKRAPEYAGTHHETLLGTGYPRGLDATQLSVPARIMAIADIFEALTAADRPYKRAKPLSEAVRILHGFKRRRHIDADLFDLFLTSGTYRRYAEKYLPREQIDEIDIAAYLGEVPA